jgi:hypothetical protein
MSKSNDFGQRKYLEKQLAIKLREIDDLIRSQRSTIITKSCKLSEDLGYDKFRSQQLLAAIVYHRRRLLMNKSRCFCLMKALCMNTSININEINASLNIIA